MLRSIQALFAQVVARIEGSQVPLSRYVQLFFAILSVRLALEFFSSHRLYSLADVVHIGLWFVFIVMAFLLQLHLFSREDIRKVIRLAVVGFTIALSAPILDLLISGGQGAKMNYLSINGWTWTDLVFSYFTMGGASLSRGATLGIRIEIVLLLIASFNYVHLKTSSWLRALLSSWVIYTVLFLSGTVPRILEILTGSFELHYLPDDQSTILLLLCLDLLLLACVFTAHSPAMLRQALRHANWPLILLGVLLFTTGAGLARGAYPGNWSLNPTTLFHAPLLMGLSLAFALNTGLLASNSSTRPRNVLLALILISAYAIGERFVFAVAVIWGLVFLLEEAPLYLRKVPVLRELLWAMTMLAAVLAGFVAFGGPMVGLPRPWVISVLVGSFFSGMLLEASLLTDDFIPAVKSWRMAHLRGIARAAATFSTAVMVITGIVLFDNSTGIFLGLAALPAAISILRWPSKTKWGIFLLTLPMLVLLVEAWIS